MPISSHELKYFKNRIFVETGSAGLGLGIQSALIAGFEEVYSVDINPVAYEECQEIFKNDKRVHLSLDDCGKWLDKTLNLINESCTIYLDANGWSGETESPFYSSLNAIIRHGKNHHIILCDDMNHGKRPREEIMSDLRRDCGGAILNGLRQINPSYFFYLIDTHLEDLSHTFYSWVLVADTINTRFEGTDFV